MNIVTRGSLSQAEVAPAPSYDQVWNAVMQTCKSMMPESECHRLLGYRPFICPPPAELPITSNWWFWLGVGVACGVGAMATLRAVVGR